MQGIRRRKRTASAARASEMHAGVRTARPSLRPELRVSSMELTISFACTQLRTTASVLAPALARRADAKLLPPWRAGVCGLCARGTCARTRGNRRGWCGCGGGRGVEGNRWPVVGSHLSRTHSGMRARIRPALAEGSDGGAQWSDYAVRYTKWDPTRRAPPRNRPTPGPYGPSRALLPRVARGPPFAAAFGASDGSTGVSTSSTYGTPPSSRSQPAHAS